MRVLSIVLLLGLALGTTIPAGSADSVPSVQWTDRDIWMIEHYLGTYDFVATGCDPAGHLEDVWVAIPGLGQGGDTYLPDGVTCDSVHHQTVAPFEVYGTGKGSTSVPRNFTVHVTAKTMDGTRVTQDGYLNFGPLPRDPSNVPGFPDLGQYPAPTGAVTMHLRVAPDGSIACYKLQWPGVSVDTTPGCALAGTREALVTYNPTTHLLSEGFNGIQLVNDGVFLPDGPWWNLHVVPGITTDEAQYQVHQAVFGPYP